MVKRVGRMSGGIGLGERNQEKAEMANIPTREEAGLKILAICREEDIRANEVMEWELLHPRFTNDPHWRVVDFEAGIQWCIEKRYLEEQSVKEYSLTETGFAKL